MKKLASNIHLYTRLIYITIYNLISLSIKYRVFLRNRKPILINACCHSHIKITFTLINIRCIIMTPNSKNIVANYNLNWLLIKNATKCLCIILPCISKCLPAAFIFQKLGIWVSYKSGTYGHDHRICDSLQQFQTTKSICAYR